MGRQYQARRGNGRFTRNTLENCAGLHCVTCPNPECRRLNPWAVGTPQPEACHACGHPLDGAEETMRGT